MTDLARSPNNWDPQSRKCKVIVETPKGRRNKFAYNPGYGTFELKFLLPQGLVFPFDFGFIPSTQAPDGDPLDVLILMEEPAHVGCLLDVRIIGVIEAKETEGGKTVDNHRLIGVALRTYENADVQTIDEIPRAILDQVGEFFISYNKSRGKKFEITGRKGPDEAASIVAGGIAAAKKKRKSSK